MKMLPFTLHSIPKPRGSSRPAPLPSPMAHCAPPPTLGAGCWCGVLVGLRYPWCMAYLARNQPKKVAAPCRTLRLGSRTLRHVWHTLNHSIWPCFDQVMTFSHLVKGAAFHPHPTHTSTYPWPCLAMQEGCRHPRAPLWTSHVWAWHGEVAHTSWSWGCSAQGMPSPR